MLRNGLRMGGNLVSNKAELSTLEKYSFFMNGFGDVSGYAHMHVHLQFRLCMQPGRNSSLKNGCEGVGHVI